VSSFKEQTKTLVNIMNNVFSYVCEAVNVSNTTLTQSINAGKLDSNKSSQDILNDVIESALQSTYNASDITLFTALATLNPTYKPFSAIKNSALDLAVMCIAGEVVKSVYEIKNIEVCPSMPLALEDMWNSKNFTREMKGKVKKENLLINMSQKEKEDYAHKQLNDDEGGCSGGACKL
jgi:hypothetical protein